MIHRPYAQPLTQPTRRDFLRSLALGAGTLAIAPTLLSLTGCASVTARARPATERLNIGFVGAGGIGHDLFTSVQLLYFADAGAILLIIIATIMAIDMLSEAFRHGAIGKASFAK